MLGNDFLEVSVLHLASTPPSVGMEAKLSAQPGSQHSHCGQGDLCNLCTWALPDDFAQNKAAAEWTCLPVTSGNIEVISVWGLF